ncbi:MAG: hypothetical protein E7445_03230 [Ruminococcaceae bacterium]|nr:hypothetical protein [Oscillospiraceae bacterium]
MRKRIKRSRRYKTVRNWLIVLVLAGVLYALGDFPALTKRALADEILRDNLMQEGEIVWKERDWQGRNKMYILSGDTVLRTSYYWNLLYYTRWDSDILYGYKGVTCVPSSGTPGELLVIGRLPEAASAVLELRVGWGIYQEKVWEYTAEGTWKTDKVISFSITETYEGEEKLFSDILRRTVYPEGYYDYTLRLYDEAGGLIGTWTNTEKQKAA